MPTKPQKSMSTVVQLDQLRALVTSDLAELSTGHLPEGERLFVIAGHLQLFPLALPTGPPDIDQEVKRLFQEAAELILAGRPIDPDLKARISRIVDAEAASVVAANPGRRPPNVRRRSRNLAARLGLPPASEALVAWRAEHERSLDPNNRKPAVEIDYGGGVAWGIEIPEYDK